MGAASIAAEIEGVEGFSLSVLNVWLSSQKEASSNYSVQKSKQNHVLWSGETKINLFGSVGVISVAATR